MEQITVELFTDPMMGLSYESEPVYRKIETHFGDRLRFRYRMGWLVRIFKKHPLISVVELREALDFSCNQETFKYVSPILRRMSGVKVF